MDQREFHPKCGAVHDPRVRCQAPPDLEGEPAPVNHPRHYLSHPSGVECITVVEHFNFNRGNCIEYVWRAGEKGGPEQEMEDLCKARWYLDREITRLEGARDGH